MSELTHADYELFRDQIRKLVLEKVAPHAAEIDQTKSRPLAPVAALAKAGLTALPFPSDLGGQDGDLLSRVIVIEETARVCATTAVTLLTNWIVLEPLIQFGDPELARSIVLPVAKGEAVAAWCMTEPAGGSDLGAITTRAVRSDTGWVINGVKRFITNAGWADWYTVLARTGEKCFGIFMVHRETPGMSFGRPERKMGLRGSPTADVIFESVEVPEIQVIGDPEKGLDYMLAGLTNSRPIVAAEALGLAQGALDEAVRYTAQRLQFGQPVGRSPMIRGMVADMAVKVESSRALLYRAVDYAANDPAKAKVFASMAKLLCSDTAMSVTTDAVQLHGGYGYIEDYPVERMMRDAKITQIYEGTNQIQRLIIAKHIYEVASERA